MKTKVAFFSCDVCGNIVELIKNGGGKLVCCGKPMVKIEANTVDASKEKHVPAATRKEGKIIVEVGSDAHPMVDEHYIEWIVLVTDTGLERVALSPGNEPKAVFYEKPENADVYAYCNLHGLWKATV
jgi:superoxide reductase